MGNSISLNVVADEGHLTVNSQRGGVRNGNGSPFESPLLSPLSDDSSDVSRVTSAFSDSDSESNSNHNFLTTGNSNELSAPTSPCPKMRQCWICYGEEEISERVDFNARWVAPCKCKGTTKWVHQACLLDWIDSQVMNNATLATNRTSPVIPTTPTALNPNSPAAFTNQAPPRFQAGDGPLVLESVNLSCPQCHAAYKVSEAHALPRPFLLFIDWMARVKERVLLWSTFGFVSGSIYTVAFSYGFFNGWILGGAEYLDFIRDVFTNGSVLNRLQISAGIPLTPLFALSASFPMFTWTYPLVPLFLFDGRNRVSITQPRGILLFLPLVWSTHRIIVNSLIPALYKRTRRLEESEATNYQSNPVLNVDDNDESLSSSNLDSSMSSLTQTPSNSTVKISILSTTGALLFPSASALTGWLITALLPSTVASKISPFYRSLIGAGLLVAFKDLSKLLYWYQTVKLRKYRRVLNRSE